MASLTEQQKRTFINDDLYHELRCLMGAATLWNAFKAQDKGFDVAVAMDSSFVHTRCLYKFFTQQQSSHDISITEFGTTKYQSTLFDKWEEALNRHVLHISKGRANPTNTDSTVQLKDLVLDFARDIDSMWQQLEADSLVAAFATELQNARARAVQDAGNDATHHNVKPLFA